MCTQASAWEHPGAFHELPAGSAKSPVHLSGKADHSPPRIFQGLRGTAVCLREARTLESHTMAQSFTQRRLRWSVVWPSIEHPDPTGRPTFCEFGAPKPLRHGCCWISDRIFGLQTASTQGQMQDVVRIRKFTQASLIDSHTHPEGRAPHTLLVRQVSEPIRRRLWAPCGARSGPKTTWLRSPPSAV